MISSSSNCLSPKSLVITVITITPPTLIFSNLKKQEKPHKEHLSQTLESIINFGRNELHVRIFLHINLKLPFMVLHDGLIVLCVHLNVAHNNFYLRLIGCIEYIHIVV